MGFKSSSCNRNLKNAAIIIMAGAVLQMMFSFAEAFAEFVDAAHVAGHATSVTCPPSGQANNHRLIGILNMVVCGLFLLDIPICLLLYIGAEKSSVTRCRIFAYMTLIPSIGYVVCSGFIAHGQPGRYQSWICWGKNVLIWILLEVYLIWTVEACIQATKKTNARQGGDVNVNPTGPEGRRLDPQFEQNLSDARDSGQRGQTQRMRNGLPDSEDAVSTSSK